METRKEQIRKQDLEILKTKTKEEKKEWLEHWIWDYEMKDRWDDEDYKQIEVLRELLNEVEGE